MLMLTIVDAHAHYFYNMIHMHHSLHITSNDIANLLLGTCHIHYMQSPHECLSMESVVFSFSSHLNLDIVIYFLSALPY
jgi:hypothetical protein